VREHFEARCCTERAGEVVTVVAFGIRSDVRRLVVPERLRRRIEPRRGGRRCDHIWGVVVGEVDRSEVRRLGREGLESRRRRRGRRGELVAEHLVLIGLGSHASVGAQDLCERIAGHRLLGRVRARAERRRRRRCPWTGCLLLGEIDRLEIGVLCLGPTLKVEPGRRRREYAHFAVAHGPSGQRRRRGQRTDRAGREPELYL